MAHGVRLIPQADRHVPDNALIVLRDQSRPFKAPPGEKLEDIIAVCNTCGQQHLVKTYHLQLVDGAVIVSEGIWEKFQMMPDHGGFEFVNYVENPPAQGISLAAVPSTAFVVTPHNISTVKERGSLARRFRSFSKTSRAGES